MASPGRPLEPPRPIEVAHPVRVVLVGGFLGAGKTTAIGALATELIERGKRVAIVTNDQAPGLVDTLASERLGCAVSELAGGCFCCRFEDMLDAVVKVLPSEPDVIVCEPVGSCTDMAATVLNPLKVFYPHAFSLAPFTVLADPARVRQFVLSERADLFGPEVGYIFRKQLDESDAIALTKCDRADAAETQRLSDTLTQRYGRPVLQLAAISGEGIARWADFVLSEHPAGGYVLGDVDYDAYAKGEAALGWLNATVRLSSASAFDARQLLAAIVEPLRAAFRDSPAPIAHLKAAIDGGAKFVRAHAVSEDEPATYHPDAPATLTQGLLTLNARIAIEPDELEVLARRAIDEAASAARIDATVETLRCFSPSYPNPPYLMRDAS